MILSLKVSYSIANSLNANHQTEICCEIDFDDIENDEKTELDEESKELSSSFLFNSIFNDYKNTTNHSVINDSYSIQYLEFATPPPEPA